MSSTSTTAPAPTTSTPTTSTGATPSTVTAPRRGVGDRLRELVAGTPGALRVLGATTAVVALLFGALGAVAVGARSGDISAIRADAAQLVLLQDARTNLVAADAAATNAFLVGGLEPAETRQDYEEGVQLGTDALTAAGLDAETDDIAGLTEVNQALVRYTGLIESARANNRQGFPVGVAYLRQASDLMRVEVLPSLESLTESVDARVAASYQSSETAGSLLWLIGLGTIAVLVGAAVWLAQKTRRWLSLPLVVAIGAVVAGTVIAGGAMLYAQSQATDVRDGAYARSAQLAQARVDAFDAKSNESLGLINRGSGATFETRPGGFDELMQSAQDVIPAEPEALPASLAGYDDVHTEVRTLDDAGNWEAAVDLAVTDGPDGSNAAFDTFDEVSDEQLGAATEQVDDDLSAARQPLGFARLLLVVAGIVAALAAWQAFAVRLREYQ